MPAILQWIDLVWLPLAWVVAAKRHRWIMLGFLAMCMTMMRLLVELMQSAGYSYGMMGIWHMAVYARGLAVYSFFYACYLIFAHYQPHRDVWLFLAASFGFFAGASMCFSIIMVP